LILVENSLEDKDLDVKTEVVRGTNMLKERSKVEEHDKEKNQRWTRRQTKYFHPESI
jgi:hypothetical protein